VNGGNQNKTVGRVTSPHDCVESEPENGSVRRDPDDCFLLEWFRAMQCGRYARGRCIHLSDEQYTKLTKIDVTGSDVTKNRTDISWS
jgi:hypothetical protein